MSIIGIITTVGTVAAGVGAVASLAGKYAEGSALEDTDFRGMMDDAGQLFDDNITNMREKAGNAFKEVQFGWKQGTRALSDTATNLWEQAGGNNDTLATSGEDSYVMEQGILDLDRNAESLTQKRKLDETSLQTQFEGEELAMTQDYEEEIADLGGADKAADKWYPGKNIKKAANWLGF